jgi:hypothetical protein
MHKKSAKICVAKHLRHLRAIALPANLSYKTPLEFFLQFSLTSKFVYYSSKK